MDFIIPGGEQISQDLADAWAMLHELCDIKAYPRQYAEIDVAERTNYMSEIEAIREVYRTVAKLPTHR
jgi:hypothetical protein